MMGNHCTVSRAASTRMRLGSGNWHACDFCVAGDSFVGCAEFQFACFFHGRKIGLTTVVVSDRFCKVQRSWRSEERCTAVLFGSVFVMAVFAWDSGEDLEDYEKFIKEATWPVFET